jgi:carboxyl-terminal processing protease
MKRNYKILLAIVLLSATLFAFKMKSGVDSNPDKTNYYRIIDFCA